MPVGICSSSAARLTLEFLLLDFVRYSSSLEGRRESLAGEVLLLLGRLFINFAGRSLEGWRKLDLDFERLLEGTLRDMISANVRSRSPVNC